MRVSAPTRRAESPSVSLLLPTYNAGHVLDHVLERLHANTTYPRVEIVAVDDGSTDDSGTVLRRWRDSARFPSFRLIEKPNGGAIETLNTALQAATGEVVVQLDADASVETPGWTERMLALLLCDPRVGVVTVRVVLDSGFVHACGVSLVSPTGMHDRPSRLTEAVGRRTWHYRAERVRDGSAPEIEEVPAEVDSGLGCCLMYWRSEAVAAGGYDTGFAPVWFDDVDLCLSIRRMGKKVFYLPEVRVTHHVHGRHGRPADATAIQRLRASLKRSVPAPVRRRLRRRLDPDAGFSDEQRERLIHHYGYWREKWGWDPLNPNMMEVVRRWGDTEVCWAQDPERVAAGRDILASHASGR